MKAVDSGLGRKVPIAGPGARGVHFGRLQDHFDFFITGLQKQSSNLFSEFQQ